jgi:hypothetical protein
MHSALIVGWTLWAFSALCCASGHVVQRIARSRALHAALADDTDVPSLHQPRVLTNLGDCRDPIERHQDAMASGTRVAVLAVAALLLWGLGVVA